MRFKLDELPPALRLQVEAQLQTGHAAFYPYNNHLEDAPVTPPFPAHKDAYKSKETPNDPSPRVRHTKPKHHARTEQVVVNEDQEAGPDRIEVRITRLGSRLLDADNLAGGMKYLIDALRYEGLIPEDNPEAIKLIIGQRKVKARDKGTVIEIIYP